MRMRATAPFVYVRLHGPGRLYAGSYSDGDLRCGRLESTNRGVPGWSSTPISTTTALAMPFATPPDSRCLVNDPIGKQDLGAGRRGGSKGPAVDNLGLQRVVAVVRPENAASRKVLAKAGLRQVGTGHHYGRRHRDLGDGTDSRMNHRAIGSSRRGGTRG